MAENIIRMHDSAVDATLDAELRALLSSCFSGPASAIFARQRFHYEMPTRRWMVRDQRGLAAHIAAHDKTFAAGGIAVRSGGIAEVCVRADRRGAGLVRTMLEALHRDLLAEGIGWSTLFGDPRVYGSSGYRATLQPLRYLHVPSGAWRVEARDNFLIARLDDRAPPWPSGELDLRGPDF
jgi:predicted acetyltransferase